MKIVVAGRVKDPFFHKAKLAAEVCHHFLLISSSLYIPLQGRRKEGERQGA
jgi:hypothetical protein